MSSPICLALVLVLAAVLFLLDRRIARIERNLAHLNACGTQQSTGDHQVDTVA